MIRPLSSSQNHHHLEGEHPVTPPMWHLAQDSASFSNPRGGSVRKPLVSPHSSLHSHYLRSSPRSVFLFCPLQEASLVWRFVSLAWLLISCAGTRSFLFLRKGTLNQLAVSLGGEDRNLLHTRIPPGGNHAKAERAVRQPLRHLVTLTLLPAARRKKFEILVCQLPQAVGVTFWSLYWKWCGSFLSVSARR